MTSTRGHVRHFVALANEGDIGARTHQRSVIYELLTSDASAAAQPARAGEAAGREL
jgi:hypothetical protein